MDEKARAHMLDDYPFNLPANLEYFNYILKRLLIAYFH